MAAKHDESAAAEVPSPAVAETAQRRTAGESRGLLYVETNCARGRESEFHAWYNTEHVPERLSIPGFLTGSRYVALEGSPRWLAAYEVESTAVFESAEYLRWRGPAETVWTKRVTSFQMDFRRTVHTLAWRGQAPTVATSSRAPAVETARWAVSHPAATATPHGLLALRYDAPRTALQKINPWHDLELAPRLLRLPGVAAARRYTTEGSETEQLALCELSDPWVVQQPDFIRLWTEGWERFRPDLTAWKRNLYLRILRSEAGR